MDLYIIGAGDVGGFLAYHVSDMGSFNLKGFLDDDVSKHGKSYYESPILGFIDDIISVKRPVAVAIAIANPTVKIKITKRLKRNPQILFPTFVHPTVWLGKNTKVEQGCIIYPGVNINYETLISEFSTINMNATIGHNCTVGQCVTLSPSVNLGGFTEIGDGSFLGIGASTLQGISIGKNSIVGGMSIILQNVPDDATVVGNPGRLIKIN